MTALDRFHCIILGVLGVLLPQSDFLYYIALFCTANSIHTYSLQTLHLYTELRRTCTCNHQDTLTVRRSILEFYTAWLGLIL